MVFPIGAYRKEFAADHLDRLLGKSILDRLFHKRGVTESSHASSTNQPEGKRDGRCPETERNSNDEQCGVELRGTCAKKSDVEIATVEFADPVHTTGDQYNDKEKNGVSEETVDAQHEEDDEVVAGEVGQVVVDTALHFAKVGGLGDTLYIEKLGDGFEIGKTRAHRCRAHALEAVAEARSDEVDGDLELGHCCWLTEESDGKNIKN